MATLLPVPKARFFDADGNPLSGGKVYSYEAGTTTPLATYTDALSGIENANPVILDARGEADIWLLGAYKIMLTDADDVEQWTVDDISFLGTADNVIYFPTPSLAGGAVARTVEGKLRESVSVGDFGAVCSGGVDDTAAVQNAVNYCAATGYALENPSGECKITHVDIPNGFHNLYGNGLFYDSPSTSGFNGLFTISGNTYSGATASDVTIRTTIEIREAGTKAAIYSEAVNGLYVQDSVIKQIELNTATVFHAVHIVAGNGLMRDVVVQNSVIYSIIDPSVRVRANNAIEIISGGDSFSVVISDNVISNFTTGVAATGISFVTVLNNKISSDGAYPLVTAPTIAAIWVRNSPNSQIAFNQIKDQHRAGIFCDGSDDSDIVYNQIFGELPDMALVGIAAAGTRVHVENNTITSNIATWSVEHGIVFTSGVGVSVYNNKISARDHGLTIQNQATNAYFTPAYTIDKTIFPFSYLAYGDMAGSRIESNTVNDDGSMTSAFNFLIGNGFEGSSIAGNIHAGTINAIGGVIEVAGSGIKTYGAETRQNNWIGGHIIRFETDVVGEMSIHDNQYINTGAYPLSSPTADVSYGDGRFHLNVTPTSMVQSHWSPIKTATLFVFDDLDDVSSVPGLVLTGPAITTDGVNRIISIAYNGEKSTWVETARNF